MYNILAYVLFILICSDHFMDTSNDILQAPVLEAAVQALQELMKDDEVLSNTLCHVTCTLITQHQWKQGEEWVWEFALAHILACVDNQHITDTMSQAMGSLFSHGNPAVQMVLAKPLVECSSFDGCRNLPCSWKTQLPLGMVLCSLWIF